MPSSLSGIDTLRVPLSHPAVQVWPRRSTHLIPVQGAIPGDASIKSSRIVPPNLAAADRGGAL
jgi:hypothetical protein